MALDIKSPVDMHGKSVRFKLTLWLSLTLIVTVAAVFASFYFITQRELYRQTDTILASHASKVADIMSTKTAQNDGEGLTQPLHLEFGDTPGMLTIVTDGKGDITDASQNLVNKTTVARSLFERIQHDRKPVIQNMDVGAIAMRFMIIPLRQNDTLNTVVIVGHPIDIVQKSLKSLYITLIAVFFGFVLPSVVAGYVIAGIMLRPVAALRESMRRITSENLSERIPNPSAKDEFGLLTETFNELLDRLQGAFTRERQFIGDVAHEIKTPLATIRSTAETAMNRDRKKEEYQTALTNVITITGKMGETLQNILDLAWSKTVADKQGNETTNMKELVDELGEIVQQLTIAKHIDVSIHRDGMGIVMGRKDKIFRSLLNIIDNAVKYTPKGGSIRIDVASRNGTSRIQIRDSGIGIPETDIPHIFDRFYRGDRTDKYTGSGLGLAISKSLIDSLGGHISVSSKQGSTKFTIELPEAVIEV